MPEQSSKFAEEENDHLFLFGRGATADEVEAVSGEVAADQWENDFTEKLDVFHGRGVRITASVPWGK